MKIVDVIEVTIAEPQTVRVISSGLTERNAEGTISMAVMRRGVETSFFTTCSHTLDADTDAR